jgi:hypothetical protein
MLKDKNYSTLQNTQNVASISLAELQHAISTVFVECNKCLRAIGYHFQSLVKDINIDCNTSNYRAWS